VFMRTPYAMPTHSPILSRLVTGRSLRALAGNRTWRHISRRSNHSGRISRTASTRTLRRRDLRQTSESAPTTGQAIEAGSVNASVARGGGCYPRCKGLSSRAPCPVPCEDRCPGPLVASQRCRTDGTVLSYGCQSVRGRGHTLRRPDRGPYD
jgi:hypothetical protein